MVISLTVASSCADVAQSVAHLIGSEEVTGPIPVISSCQATGKPRFHMKSGLFSTLQQGSCVLAVCVKLYRVRDEISEKE